MPLATLGVKREVCKDLVVWPEPGWTCWDATGAAVRVPLAVQEWKVNERSARRRAADHAWLADFCRTYAGVTGYAVSVESGVDRVELAATRFAGGEKEEGWVSLALDRGGSSQERC